MPHDSIGWIHTLAAIIALVAGSIILFKPKGTFLHKKTGRVYGISMLIVCTNSFIIYRVHNTFGVLHFFAVVSTITLLLGMFPMYYMGYKNRIVAHLSWMYWSVIGLYCAFAAEIFTRLPILFHIEASKNIFYALVGISTGLVGFIGSCFFKKNKKTWEERFGA